MRSTPAGVRLYGVGDIHGRNDLLLLLLSAIGNDAKTAQEKRLIFLGDYVDRGPNAREVVDTLLWLSRERPDACVFLKGNHDDALLKFLDDAEIGPLWCSYGGRETLISYGVTPAPLNAPPETWEETRKAFAERVPLSHRIFFESLQLCAEFGDYFFAHAGVRPDLPLSDQSEDDLLWIRDEFLSGKTYLEKTIVHGHTPEPEPYVSARRIGLDTGAYALGVLTAVVLDGTARRLIQARSISGKQSLRHIDIT